MLPWGQVRTEDIDYWTWWHGGRPWPCLVLFMLVHLGGSLIRGSSRKTQGRTELDWTRLGFVRHLWKHRRAEGIVDSKPNRETDSRRIIAPESSLGVERELKAPVDGRSMEGLEFKPGRNYSDSFWGISGHDWERMPEVAEATVIGGGGGV